MIFPRPKKTAMFFNVADNIFLIESGLSLSELITIAVIEMISNKPIIEIVANHKPL